jgi:hypothetical protein
MEEGTHEALMNLNGEYRRLYDLQMQDKNSASADLWPEAETFQ